MVKMEAFGRVFLHFPDAAAAAAAAAPSHTSVPVNDPPGEAIRAGRPPARLPATTMARLVTAAALLALLSAGRCGEKLFLQRAGTAFNSRPYKSVLNVTNGEKFGDWTWPEMCPESFYAVGFSLRVKAQTHWTCCGVERVKL